MWVHKPNYISLIIAHTHTDEQVTDMWVTEGTTITCRDRNGHVA